MSEESMVERVAKALCDDTLKRWRTPIGVKAEPWREFIPAARAAIETMKDVPLDALGAMYEAMFEDKWDCSQAPMVGAGWDAAIDFFLNEKA